jgi:uncharacterized damage-inducible protein DinB
MPLMEMPLDAYRHRGARALVILHEHHMRRFLGVWRAADAADVTLPATSDDAYASRSALLRHVLSAARGYMTWMTKQLELPDPGIETVPDVGEVDARAERYLEHVLDRWRTPLADVPEDRFEDRTYPIWGVEYSIDAMLEHAVMHPIRHAFQLEELLADQRA